MFVSHRHHSRRCGCRMVRISLSVFELVSLMFFFDVFLWSFYKKIDPFTAFYIIFHFFPKLSVQNFIFML